MDNSDTQATLQVVLDALKENREEMREAQKAAANAKRERRWTMVLCLIALIACLATGAFLAVLASGIQIKTTTTTVEQSTADGGDAVYQSGENAQFFAGGEE